MKVEEILIVIIGLLSLIIFYKIFKGSLIEGAEDPKKEKCLGQLNELCPFTNKETCDMCVTSNQHQLMDAGCDSNVVDDYCNKNPTPPGPTPPGPTPGPVPPTPPPGPPTPPTSPKCLTELLRVCQTNIGMNCAECSKMILEKNICNLKQVTEYCNTKVEERKKLYMDAEGHIRLKPPKLPEIPYKSCGFEKPLNLEAWGSPWEFGDGPDTINDDTCKDLVMGSSSHIYPGNLSNIEKVCNNSWIAKKDADGTTFSTSDNEVDHMCKWNARTLACEDTTEKCIPKIQPMDGGFCSKSSNEQWDICRSLNRETCSTHGDGCKWTTRYAGGKGGHDWWDRWEGDLGRNNYPGCMVNCAGCGDTRQHVDDCFKYSGGRGDPDFLEKCNNKYEVPSIGNTKLCVYNTDKDVCHSGYENHTGDDEHDGIDDRFCSRQYLSFDCEKDKDGFCYTSGGIT